MPDTLLEHYEALLCAGELEQDGAQRAALAKLSALEERLRERGRARKSSALGWLFGGAENARDPVRGLYIHGDVGRGKTMLVDLFFAASVVEKKRRAHFHEFMLDVHGRVHRWRQARKRGDVTGEDPIEPVAAALAAEATLLCFDEFQVTDIADAMILGRLFTQLFARGVVLVATSNVAPDNLYEGGLNRALFLPFIALLKEHTEVFRLGARTDYRRERYDTREVWHVPADTEAKAALDESWRVLTGGSSAKPETLVVGSRPLRVPAAARRVARFPFAELCGQPLGAADYLRLARRYHTILIDDIPVMRLPQRNEARRFITLIDALYDHHVKLIASAAAEPDALYLSTEGNEAWGWKRTASRLMEMRSEIYLTAPHERWGAAGSAVAGIVET